MNIEKYFEYEIGVWSMEKFQSFLARVSPLFFCVAPSISFWKKKNKKMFHSVLLVLFFPVFLLAISSLFYFKLRLYFYFYLFFFDCVDSRSSLAVFSFACRFHLTLISGIRADHSAWLGFIRRFSDSTVIFRWEGGVSLLFPSMQVASGGWKSFRNCLIAVAWPDGWKMG